METTHGKVIGEPLTHILEIKEIGLSQTGGMQSRCLTFIDVGHHLYIVPVQTMTAIKLSNMVDSALWHPSTDMLATVVEQELVSGTMTSSTDATCNDFACFMRSLELKMHAPCLGIVIF